jgi:hypothetical protein
MLALLRASQAKITKLIVRPRNLTLLPAFHLVLAANTLLPLRPAATLEVATLEMGAEAEVEAAIAAVVRLSLSRSPRLSHPTAPRRQAILQLLPATTAVIYMIHQLPPLPIQAKIPPPLLPTLPIVPDLPTHPRILLVHHRHHLQRTLAIPPRLSSDVVSPKKELHTELVPGNGPRGSGPY